MPQTIRKYWGPWKGRIPFNFNWSAIDHDSTVLISASEYNNQKVRFLGAASIQSSPSSRTAPHTTLTATMA